ncbi:MAG: flagellin [Candidatus Zixiibacteriota bacterium]
MRSVDDVTISSYYRNLMSREKRLTDIQQTISSGKNFEKASQAPSDAIELMRINVSKQCMARQTKRLEKNREIVEQASTMYSNIDNLMLEIDELAMDVVSGTKTLDMKRNILSHIDSLSQEIAQEASREYMGKPLLGNYERVEKQTYGEFQKIARRDKQMLHITDKTKMNVLPEGNIDDMLNEINEFCKAIENGDDKKANSHWQSMRSQRSKLQDENGALGSKSQFMESLIERNSDQETSYETVRARIEDLDVAKASIDLYNAENSFNLALQTAQRMQQELDPTKFFDPQIR